MPPTSSHSRLIWTHQRSPLTVCDADPLMTAIAVIADSPAVERQSDGCARDEARGIASRISPVCRGAADVWTREWLGIERKMVPHRDRERFLFAAAGSSVAAASRQIAGPLSLNSIAFDGSASAAIGAAVVVGVAAQQLAMGGDGPSNRGVSSLARRLRYRRPPGDIALVRACPGRGRVPVEECP